MDSRVLTLGVVAGLAVAGLARRASGSGNAPAGRFRKISPAPTGFVTSPLSFVRGTVLELAVDPEETGKAQPRTGLYHVTTNLPAVLAEGRLRSRRALRAAGRQGAGLGGGFRDEAPDRVSVGLTLDGALRVLRATRMMAQAVHGQIEAEEAFRILKRESEGTLSLVYDEIDARADDEPDDPEAGDNWSSWADGELKDAEAKVKRTPSGPALYEALRTWEGRLAEDVFRATPGPDLYDALRRYETHVTNTLGEWTGEGWLELDEQMCGTTVGFTEPAHRFERVRPEAVGLVQLAGRKGADSEQIPSECELRFRPEDLALVGVWEGK